MISIDIEASQQELSEKTFLELQEEATTVWTSRALAAYRNSIHAQAADESLFWLETGTRYAMEATHHAAMAEESSGDLVNIVTTITSQARREATEALLGASPTEDEEQLQEETALDDLVPEITKNSPQDTL